MRIVTFSTSGGSPQAGVVAGERVYPLATTGYAQVLDFIAGGAAALDRVRLLLATAPESVSIALNAVTLHAPIPRPPKLICVGLNYRDHAAEGKMEIPAVPTIFSKFTNAITGPGWPIVLPNNSTKPDYEAELAFVIGAGGRHIAAADWRAHVYGYTCVNDVSARDFQLATSQWLMGKSFDTFCPMGPWLVTADEIADPQALQIECVVSRERLRNSNTREMIFPIPTLIEYLSSAMTLEPGDVVATGTPSGVGFAQRPRRWLRAGDEVVVRIAGIGELRNPVVAEP